MKNLITGGAGFIGSHLIDKLIEQGEEVICLDNFSTGSKENIKHCLKNPKFELIKFDVTEPIRLEIDRIWHLACPASPIKYQKDPIKTLKTSFIGTFNMLGLAKRTKARFLMASTSEIYGDPEVHPQIENYNGNVNTLGTRSCYDEGKRVAETLCFDYKRMHSVDIKLVRIFNTYGPRMSIDDGRVVSNFIVQALQNKKLTIYGDGSQTRSFCYIDDLIDGLNKFMNSDFNGPLNLGNPFEITVEHLAHLVQKKINKSSNKLEYLKLPTDDPCKRKPSIELAKENLNWVPKVEINEGLEKTINYFKSIL